MTQCNIPLAQLVYAKQTRPSFPCKGRAMPDYSFPVRRKNRRNGRISHFVCISFACVGCQKCVVYKWSTVTTVQTGSM